MHRNKSVDVHKFAMIPRADIPRSSFRRQFSHKTTFNAGVLIPVYVDEVLPGDTFNLKMTAFARMSTPIYPIMDNLYLDSFFFFVPCRLLWDNWKKFMGEQLNPGDSTAYVVPQIVSDPSGFAVGSIYDYFGLPTVGQVTTLSTVSVNALPLRAYNQIFNEWFRDENLQTRYTEYRGDGPDLANQYALVNRGKRHDYFTSCLPFAQKGTAVTLPTGTSAPVRGNLTNNTFTYPAQDVRWVQRASGAAPAASTLGVTNTGITVSGGAAPGAIELIPVNLIADLAAGVGATINQLRQSFQIQRLLERDARGGTRYTEIVRSHFGVISPDSRLQRPEYLGGGSTPISVNPVAQTSGTAASGTTTPLGNLAAIGTVLTRGNGFTQSFTEHGYILGLVSVRADLTYQQGTRKLWSRSTRYDFYWPAFAHLGEQAVLNKEIYTTGDAGDNAVFGYQERWAEYRYFPSMITGLFRSTSAGTIDGWHLAQRFVGIPVLGDTFIRENPPMSRVLAVGTGANGQQFIFDGFFDIVTARPMPMYSVPGLIDHF